MTFKIVPATPGVANSPSARDARSVVESMFYNWVGSNPEGERLVELPIQVADCSNGTPTQLGINFEDCVAVQVNYKGAADNFNGKTKGETLITFGGKRQGRAGYGSITMPIGQVEEFCRMALQATHAARQGLADAQAESEGEAVDLTED